jgi:hypothetical protein
MIALFCFFLALFASPLKSKSRLEAENAALRHQLIILRREVRNRVRLTNSDRLFFIQLCPQGHHDCPPRDPRAMAPPASACTGVGNPGPLKAGRKSMRICGR